MLRAILVVMTLAAAGLVVAAVFFCGDGPVGTIDAEGMNLYRRGKFDDALATWRAGLETYPDSPRLHYRIGTILAVRKDFEPATVHLERAVALVPDDPATRKELALLYLQQERTDDAERELRCVLDQADWFPEVHYFLGVIHEKRGERERAMEEYVQELNVNPECGYAWAKVFESDRRKGSAE
ncbi:MAG TPA: tetratricopeptide repeat protein [Planctomycetota bacterium]|nr:tetratricopeptide repeat protein [Planctomycetota bacterium]